MNFGQNTLLPDPNRVAAFRLRQLLAPTEGSPMAAAMATKDKQLYNQLVAQAFQQLQQEMGPGGLSDPHLVFKLATGKDLNSAMHVADLVENQERGFASPQDLGYGWDFKLSNPPHPEKLAGGSMLEAYGYNPDAEVGSVVRRLQNNKGVQGSASLQPGYEESLRPGRQSRF